MLKSFVCDLNIHRLLKCHYCYLANLLKGSSALQDGPVGRTALASKFWSMCLLDEAVGMQRGWEVQPLPFLKALYRACQALQQLLCILERFAVGSPKANCVELLFESFELCREPSSWCQCEIWLRGVFLLCWVMVKLCKNQVSRSPMAQGLCDWWFQCKSLC